MEIPAIARLAARHARRRIVFGAAAVAAGIVAAGFALAAVFLWLLTVTAPVWAAVIMAVACAAASLVLRALGGPSDDDLFAAAPRPAPPPDPMSSLIQTFLTAVQAGRDLR